MDYDLCFSIVEKAKIGRRISLGAVALKKILKIEKIKIEYMAGMHYNKHWGVLFS